MPAWWMFALVFGVNFTLWGTVGFLRIVDGALGPVPPPAAERRLGGAPGPPRGRRRPAAANGGLAGPTLAAGGGQDPHDR